MYDADTSVAANKYGGWHRLNVIAGRNRPFWIVGDTEDWAVRIKKFLREAWLLIDIHSNDHKPLPGVSRLDIVHPRK